MFFQSDYEIKLNQEHRFRDLARVAQTDQLLEESYPRRQAALQQPARAVLRGIGYLLSGMGTRLKQMGTREPAMTR